MKAQITQRLFRMLFGFFPVLVDGNKSNYKAEKKNADHRNNSEIGTGHRFSLCFFVNSIINILLSATRAVHCLFGRLMFRFPVLMNNNCHENNSQNCDGRSHCIKSHQISPLSRVTPPIMQKVYAITPDIIFPVSNPFFVTSCPNTTIASIKFAALKNAFARFSLCLFVNSIIYSSLIKMRGVCQERTRRAQRLFQMLFGFFPVLTNDNRTEKDGDCGQTGEKNVKKLRTFHYTPLSAIIPRTNKIRNTKNPARNIFELNPSTETTGPNMRIATTNLQMSSNVFETFSRCFFVNSIIRLSLIKMRGVCQGRMRRGIERRGTQR